MGDIKVNVVRKLKRDIEVKEHENFGIISIRHKIKGSLSEKNLTDIIGSKLPKTNEIFFLKKGYLAWMSNDEMWFIFSKGEPKKTINVLTSFTFKRLPDSALYKGLIKIIIANNNKANFFKLNFFIIFLG